MKEINENSSESFVGSRASWILHPGVQLFLVSFLSLFLELLLIRWTPSLVRIVAYYGNLMLLSSFLGLGCGVLLARRRLGLHRFFAALLFLFVVCVLTMKTAEFRQGPDEIRFGFDGGSSTTTLPIMLVFILNTLVFVPLGDLIGAYFQRMRALEAYAWDLSGAIAGTVIFGLFSYFWFSPILGLFLVMAAYFVHCRGRLHILTTGVLFAMISLAVMVLWKDNNAVWSPYYHITVKEVLTVGNEKSVSAPVQDIGSRRDPPFYIIQVNHAFYMTSGTIDLSRYSEPSLYLLNASEQYRLPYLVRPGAKEVLVVGSGGGLDVEAALLSGAERVDAVEIDPLIIQLGQQYNASQPYKDPRVSVYNTDARAFFKQTDRTYDMVVFGFLDSQGLFSQMSNVRLDGYVYTRESFREAFGLVRQGGVLSISFYSGGKVWLLDRFVAMVRSATDTAPLIYASQSGQVIILAGKGFVPQGPGVFTNYRRIEPVPLATPEAVDDWPYLYLRRHFIPWDYLETIGVLLGLSVLFLFLSSDGRRKGVDLHFFFLGAGFLLLETKSITTVSLFFGTTWFVSMIVILGVLIMVLLANYVALRLRKLSLFLYIPLIVSVGLLYLFPTQNVLAWSFFSRLLFSLIIIPIPIFFAGLIFSSSLRQSLDPSYSFGSNLLGAMVGGFLEYLGMITGTNALLLVVLVLYLMSLVVRLRSGQGLLAAA